MKILLINPPSDNGLKKGKGETPHIGVQYIASYLIKYKYDVTVIEAPANNIELKEIFDKIRKNKFDIIGLSVYFYNYYSSFRISRFIKNVDGDIFVFWGGYWSTLACKLKKIDFKYVDCMIIGEGEKTVFQLVTSIKKGIDWENISGLCYLKNGEIVTTEKRKLIEDLDILPFPYRSGNREIENIITSRGCYANCSFCAIKSFYSKCTGKRIRYRSAQNVVDEIIELINHTNVKLINFNDDNFTISSKSRSKWIKEFASLIKKNNIKMRFSCLLRSNEIISGKNELEILHNIGLEIVFVGIESFIQSHLELYNKNIVVEQNIQAIKILEDLHIRINMGFLLFNPITSLDDIEKTISIFRQINFNKKNKYCIKPISYSPVIAVEGSPLYEFVEQNELLAHNEIGYNFLNGNVELCFGEIKKWYREIEKTFSFCYLENELTGYELESLRDAFYEIFYLDLDFVESVIILIKNNRLNELDLNRINKLKLLDIIKGRLVDIEKRYLNEKNRI